MSFSTGGATHANQAVALAVAEDGDSVIVSRTLHRSMLLGLVLVVNATSIAFRSYLRSRKKW